MKKRYLFSILLLVCIGVAGFLFLQRDQQQPITKSIDGETFKAPANSLVSLSPDVHIVSDDHTLEETNKSVQEKENATDTTYSFDVKSTKKIGELQLTVREIDNGDQFVFTKFFNTTEKGATLPFKIVFTNKPSYTHYSFEEEIAQEHDRVFGIDYTSNVKGVYSLTSEQPYQLFLSQNYISKDLVEKYENGEQSVLRELVNEDKYIDITDKKDTLTFNLKLRTTSENQFSENWFLLSKEPLFSTEDEMSYYKNLTNDKFIKSPKWQTAVGTYTKLPWSVEPSTKVGYGRNLVYQQVEDVIQRYEETNERFYYDMLVNSVNYLFDFKGDASIWKTEYTSTWLKRDYGIIAPYTDTRHNEKIALFLSKAGAILNNPEIQSSDLLYADFLSTQEKIKNILPTDDGYYILDYYSEQQTKKTHVSLNHALGEMNFLFETYQNTDEQKYLDTALSIKNAVENTGTKWINPSNGDLWYQINGDYSFEGKDYDTLTLEDLIRGLKNYEELQLPYDQDLYKTLMTSKIQFLIDDELKIHTNLYNDLLALGFGHLIKDYQHVYSY
ncbi:MAG: hypothetical protein RR595_01165 [Lysinibacillus sp.]